MRLRSAVSSNRQLQSSNLCHWSYLQTAMVPLCFPFVFNDLRTLSFYIDQSIKPISFRISQLRTLLQNRGGGGILSLQFFKYYLKSGRAHRFVTGFARSLFSIIYKLPNLQALCFDNHATVGGVYPPFYSPLQALKPVRRLLPGVFPKSVPAVATFLYLMFTLPATHAQQNPPSPNQTARI